MNKLLAILARMLACYEAAYSTADLSISRILIFLLFLLLGFPDYSVVANEDPSFLNPPFLSPAYFVGSLPSAWILKGLTIATCLSATLALCGYRTALCSVVFSLTLVTGLSFVFSFGKVDHGDLFFPIVAILGAACAWGKSSKAWLSPGGFYFLVAFTIGLAFFTSGVPKLLSGWLTPGDQQVKYILINASFGLEKGTIGKWLLEHVQSTLVWESLDWLAVIFELGLIALIVKPRWFQAGLLVCVGFHFLNMLLLGISFSNAFVVYIALLPLSRIERNHYPVLFCFALLSLVTLLLLTPHHTSLASLLETLRSAQVWIPLASCWYVILFVLTGELKTSKPEAKQ